MRAVAHAWSLFLTRKNFMSVIFIALPVAIALAAAAVWGFVWAVRGGQMDDLETPPRRILFDDVEAKPQERKK